MDDDEGSGNQKVLRMESSDRFTAVYASYICSSSTKILTKNIGEDPAGLVIEMLCTKFNDSERKLVRMKDKDVSILASDTYGANGMSIRRLLIVQENVGLFPVFAFYESVSSEQRRYVQSECEFAGICNVSEDGDSLLITGDGKVHKDADSPMVVNMQTKGRPFTGEKTITRKELSKMWKDRSDILST